MNDVKIQAIVNALTEQRNQAQNSIVEFIGVIAEKEEIIKELTKKLSTTDTPD